MVSGCDVCTALCMITGRTGCNLLMSKGVFLLQGFHHSCCGPACSVAGPGHEPTSWAAYLIRRRLHVHRGFVHLLSTQDRGEFYLLILGWISANMKDVSTYAWLLSLKLSLVCFAETLDIIWPCAIVLSFIRNASLLIKCFIETPWQIHLWSNYLFFLKNLF